jgi:hypothetical protein
MPFTIWVTTCSQAPEIFRFLRRCPYFAADPWKEISPRNVTPRGGGRRGWSKFRRARRRLGRGRWGGWLGARWRPVCGLECWRKAAGGGAPRHGQTASAWSSPPASSQPGQQGGGATRLQWSREARVRGAEDCGINRGQGVAAAGANTTPTTCAWGEVGCGRFVGGGEKTCLHYDGTRGRVDPSAPYASGLGRRARRGSRGGPADQARRVRGGAGH